MDVMATIEAVSRMAREFQERGSASMVTLLRESGYMENPDEITEGDIAEYLRKYPDLIDTWVLESENQHTDKGWYIKSPAGNDSRSNLWEVGFFPGGEIHQFIDGPSACAFFVKHAVEQIRQHIRKAR